MSKDASRERDVTESPATSETSEALLRRFLESLGAEFGAGSPLARTPAYVTRLLSEYFADRPEPRLSILPAEGGQGAVLLTGLRFHSLCEHHLVPFVGTIEVAYLPDRHLVGFGGIERCIRYFALRPQLQERLTQQIAEFLFARLEPRGLAVRSRARQLCMEVTGGTPDAVVTSVCRLGTYQDEALSEIFA